jgi:Domain of Unknown Function (DUF1521)
MIQISLPGVALKIANDLVKGMPKDIAKELSSFKLAEPTTRIEGGVCIFQNENYSIRCNDNNEITIENRHDGKSIHVWGDPHVDVNDKHAFDFWGTTTFKLLDGTKVTINTTPWVVDPKQRLATSITITDGMYGVEITGIDTNTLHDLKFREYRDEGALLDELVDDGNVLFEDDEPTAFFAIDAEGTVLVVDQAYIDETDLARTLEVVNRFAYYFGCMQNLDSVTLRGALFDILNDAAQRDQTNAPVPRRKTLVIRKLAELDDQLSNRTLDNPNKNAAKPSALPLKLRVERYSAQKYDNKLS